MQKNKTRIKTCVLIFLLFTVISLTPGCIEFENLINQGDNTDGTYTIIFKVTDLETGSVIPAARILLNDRIFHTDNNGKNIISKLEGGTYTFNIDTRETSDKTYNVVNQQITLSHDVQITVKLSINKSSVEIVEV